MADRILDEVSKSSFFTSINGDRPYNDRDFVAYLGAAVGNGVLDPNDVSPASSKPLAVGSISANQITINPGAALLGGEFGYLARLIDPTGYDIPFTPPSSGTRWDRVVLRLNNNSSDRTIKFAVITGTSSKPVGDAGLTQEDVTNGGVYEILLFDVEVPETANLPITTIDYTYTPYVQYETKPNKSADIASDVAPTVHYPTVQAIINYALPLSGGSGFAMVGDLYMGNHIIYDVNKIAGKSGQPLILEGNGAIDNGYVYIKPAGETGSYTARFGGNAIDFDQLFKANYGIITYKGASDYSLWSTDKFILDGSFEFNGVMVTDLNMGEYELINTKVNYSGEEIASRGTIIYTASTSTSGTKIEDLTTDSDGHTFPASLIPAEARSLKIHFSRNSRSVSSPFPLADGIQVAEVSALALAVTSAYSDANTFTGIFRIGTNDLYMYNVQIKQIDGGGIKIWDPRYTSGSLGGTIETDIWIHKIEIIY